MKKKIRHCECCGRKLKFVMGSQKYCNNCAVCIHRLKGKILQLKKELRKRGYYCEGEREEDLG